MTIKDKIKEIENASEELLVPDHEPGVIGELVRDASQASQEMFQKGREHESGVIGELVREASDASKELFSKGHDHDASEVIGEMVHETADAANEMLGKDKLKKAPEGKLDELAKEIEDAADAMLSNK